MPSRPSYTMEEDVEEDHELILDSEEDGDSGDESFLTDDELAYQEGLDPAEDDDYQQDEEPCTSASGQQADPPASPEELASSGEQPPPQGRGHEHTQPRAQSRSPPHSRPQLRAAASGREHSVSPGRSRTRSRSPLQAQSRPIASAMSWKTESDPDICPAPMWFVPARPPGHQLNSSSTYKPLDLFKLFLSNDTAQTLCRHTNKQAAKNIAKGKKYSWTDINTQDFFKYVGLTFFFSLVKLNKIQDYWKKNTIFSVPFPANVMARDKYRMILWNLQISDPDKDAENDRKKGTADHDRLFRLRPLLDNIKHACKAFYHPRQNLSIDERMVATKAHAGLTRFVKFKPPKLGFKLFVLTDSSNGYTLDFSVYTGKSQFASGVGLAYDSVMSLIKPAYLGSGFHLFVDSFHTSPKLFKDLFSMNIGACGTYRDNRRGCPRTQSNALKKRDPRGSLRWIRDDKLVFVKWMDTREVGICSTIHQAFSGNIVQRRVKTENGNWTTKSFPCPTPVIEFNKYMGGVDLSDQLIQYHSVRHKTMRWYRTLFFHFLEIAATNSYLLHKELCREKQEEPLTYNTFLEELAAQLCGVSVVVPPAKARSGHLPVAISLQTDASKRASYGRKTCVHCRQTRKAAQSTPWKCKQCDVALCLIADRNCFEAWHN